MTTIETLEALTAQGYRWCVCDENGEFQASFRSKDEKDWCHIYAPTLSQVLNEMANEIGIAAREEVAHV